MTNYKELINVYGNSLWGISGGQLEYVSQRVEYRTHNEGGMHKVLVIRFTDHDVQATKHFADNKELVDNQFYDLEFPL